MLIADDPNLPYYVGKGTGNRLFESLGEKYDRLLEDGWPIKGPQFYRAYWLFTDIAKEDVAFGLETLTIYGFDEDEIALLNRQRRKLSADQTYNIFHAHEIQDFIVFHPVPVQLPRRICYELGLDQHVKMTNLHFNAAWIDMLQALGNGVLL